MQNEYLPPSQPQPIYTDAQRTATLQEWNQIWGGPISDRFREGTRVLAGPMQTLILDVLTTMRLGAPAYWDKFRRNVSVIFPDERMSSGASASLNLPNVGGGAHISLGPGFFGKTLLNQVDWNSVVWPRRTILKILLHEGYHHPNIAGSLDALYEIQPSELVAGGISRGSAAAEENTEWRAIKTLSFIGQTQGWAQVYGNDDFHFTDSSHAYQVVHDSVQQTYTKYYYSFQAFNFAAAKVRPLTTNPYWTYAAGRPGEGAYFINNAVIYASGRTLLKIEFSNTPF